MRLTSRCFAEKVIKSSDRCGAERCTTRFRRFAPISFSTEGDRFLRDRESSGFQFCGVATFELDCLARQTLIGWKRSERRTAVDDVSRKLLSSVDGGLSLSSRANGASQSTARHATDSSRDKSRRLLSVTRESLSSGTEPFGSRLISARTARGVFVRCLFSPTPRRVFRYLFGATSIIAKLD